MVKVRSLALLIVLVFSQGIAIAQSAGVYTAYVDPFLGTYIGNTLPGANTPFGMVKLGPDIMPPNNTTGYRADKSIVGFSHNHLSGTGGGARYGNIQIIPQIGKLRSKDTANSKHNEYARPGYYTVTLGNGNDDIKAELTSSDHCGMHRYTFSILDKPKVREAYIFGHKTPQTFDANILIDPCAIINSKDYEVGRCTGSQITVVSHNEITGYSSFSGGWGGENPYRVYFVIQTDKPFQSSGIWKKGAFNKNNKEVSGVDIGAFLTFNARQDEQIQLKVGISYHSLAYAKKNLSEAPGWNFDQLRQKADDRWNAYLGKIKVQGGTPEQRNVFYTALYHTMIMPVRIDNNPQWRTTIPHYWDFYTLWDTYRTVMPLHTLILPERQREMVNCLLDIYKHKQWLPDAWTAGDFAMVQGGTSADVVIADAIIKNLPGIDRKLGYQAIRKDATQASDNPFKYGRYEEYFLKGYCSADIKNGSSKTLEYAYNDFCVAQAARALGLKQDYARFLKQSDNAFHLFMPDSGYVWAKTPGGDWIKDFSPFFRRPDYWNGPYFYEGTPYSYSFYVPHNIQKLIQLHGGDQKFIAFLDRFFDNGHYELGNEPGFLTPYLYNYAGRPDKSADRVHDQLREFKVGNVGLPGQDDSGAMSGWFVFSAMGFFPSAGQDVYLIGSPIFERSEVELGSGKKFIVVAERLSPANRYIQKAYLNDQPLNRTWFRHSAIANGGILRLLMGPKPSQWGKKSVPPSNEKI